MLGQLGESRLVAAIDTDIAGEQAHSRALDADTKGTAARHPPARRHRDPVRVVRRADRQGGAPAGAALRARRARAGHDLDRQRRVRARGSVLLRRKAGTDGFRIGYQPTMKKVVSDRRASLDEETEIKPAMRKLVEEEFRRGASIPVVPFPGDGAEIPDTPRLTLVVADPELEWTGGGALREQLAEWTKQPREVAAALSGGARLVPQEAGRDLREKVELARVEAGGARGRRGHARRRVRPRATGRSFRPKVKDAEGAAKDEVWGDYRFAVVADGQEPDGLKGSTSARGTPAAGDAVRPGHRRAQVQSAAQRVRRRRLHRAQLAAGARGVRRVAACEPAAELPQRVAHAPRRPGRDPSKAKIVEFVVKGDFGLASGRKPDGGYERIWFQELVAPDEIAFRVGCFLALKSQKQSP